MKMTTTHTLELTEDTNLLDLVKEFPEAFDRVTEDLYKLQRGYLIKGYEHLYWPMGLNFVLPKGWINLKWLSFKMLSLFDEFLNTGKVPDGLGVKYSYPCKGSFLEKANPFTCYPYLLSIDSMRLIVIDTLAGPDNPMDFTCIYDIELSGFSKFNLMNDKDHHAAIVYV